MRLSQKPWKLAALTLFGTVAYLAYWPNLMDGEVTLRHGTTLSTAATPIRFFLFAATYVLSGFAIVGGWWVLQSEWKMEYRAPHKQKLDDPERRRRY